MENKNNAFEPMQEESATGHIAEQPQPDRRTAKMAEARKNLRAGLLWCLGGLAVSFISYYMTTSDGRYLVSTGTIIWGAIQAIKGLWVILKIQYRERRFAAFWRTAALSVCSLAAIIYLGQLSARLTRGEVIPLETTEQLYTCDTLNFRVRIPVGYTRFEELRETATAKKYASFGLYTNNETINSYISAVVNIIPQGAASVDEIRILSAQRDSAFYTGGFIAPSQRTVVGGREMLCSEGSVKEYPKLIYATFDIPHGSSIVTAMFTYEKKYYGKRETREQIEELLNGIELGE